MTPTLPFAVTILAVVSIALALVFGRSAPVVVAAEPVIETVIETGRFTDVWNDAAAPLTLKSESLRPRFALIDPIEIEPVTVTQLDPPEQPKPTTVKRKTKKYIARDVCQRHGMKKVKIGKYRWRCRR